jgi:hypothetical protein
MRDDAPFAMAGLWESWTDPQQGETIATCTVVTTDANELTQPIHDRMPAILSAESYGIWLDHRKCDKQVLLPLLRPFDASVMVAHPVSPRVNNPRNNDPGCVEILGLVLSIDEWRASSFNGKPKANELRSSDARLALGRRRLRLAVKRADAFGLPLNERTPSACR